MILQKPLLERQLSDEKRTLEKLKRWLDWLELMPIRG
jgi:hypothetical protein